MNTKYLLFGLALSALVACRKDIQPAKALKDVAPEHITATIRSDFATGLVEILLLDRRDSSFLFIPAGSTLKWKPADGSDYLACAENKQRNDRQEVYIYSFTPSLEASERGDSLDIVLDYNRSGADSLGYDFGHRFANSWALDILHIEPEIISADRPFSLLFGGHGLAAVEGVSVYIDGEACPITNRSAQAITCTAANIICSEQPQVLLRIYTETSREDILSWEIQRVLEGAVYYPAHINCPEESE